MFKGEIFLAANGTNGEKNGKNGKNGHELHVVKELKIGEWNYDQKEDWVDGRKRVTQQWIMPHRQLNGHKPLSSKVVAEITEPLANDFQTAPVSLVKVFLEEANGFSTVMYAQVLWDVREMMYLIKNPSRSKIMDISKQPAKIKSGLFLTYPATIFLRDEQLVASKLNIQFYAEGVSRHQSVLLKKTAVLNNSNGASPNGSSGPISGLITQVASTEKNMAHYVKFELYQNTYPCVELGTDVLGKLDKPKIELRS